MSLFNILSSILLFGLTAQALALPASTVPLDPASTTSSPTYSVSLASQASNASDCMGETAGAGTTLPSYPVPTLNTNSTNLAATNASAVGSTGSTNSTGSTSGSGALKCGADGKTFKLSSGPSQPVALGTVCKDGQIAMADGDVYATPTLPSSSASPTNAASKRNLWDDFWHGDDDEENERLNAGSSSHIYKRHGHHDHSDDEDEDEDEESERLDAENSSHIYRRHRHHDHPDDEDDDRYVMVPLYHKARDLDPTQEHGHGSSPSHPHGRRSRMSASLSSVGCIEKKDGKCVAWQDQVHRRQEYDDDDASGVPQVAAREDIPIAQAEDNPGSDDYDTHLKVRVAGHLGERPHHSVCTQPRANGGCGGWGVV